MARSDESCSILVPTEFDASLAKEWKKKFTYQIRLIPLDLNRRVSLTQTQIVHAESR